MRPSSIVFILLIGILCSDVTLYFLTLKKRAARAADLAAVQQMVNSYGLTSLAISTEARYSRHPLLSDSMAPFMDHPGSIEHFPSGSFVLPAGKLER